MLHTATLSERVQYQIDKSTNQKGKIDTSNAQIHDYSLSWFGTALQLKLAGLN
jgi:hypothetical protein